MPKKAPQNVAHFLDSLRTILNVKNDAALARKVGLSAPALSKMRHHRLTVTAGLLLKLYDVTRAHDGAGLTIEQLRALLYTPAAS